MLGQQAGRMAVRNIAGRHAVAGARTLSGARSSRLLRLSAAAVPQQRRFSSGGSANERHVQLLGLRMDALKQNKLSETDLQTAFEKTVDSVGHGSHYFRALEALGALKQALRNQSVKAAETLAGASAPAKGQWPAFHPEELRHLGSAERPAKTYSQDGIASTVATAVHAGDRIRVVRGSYQGKFATVVRPTAARYIVRLDRGGEVCLAPSSMMLQQAVNARTLTAAEGRPLGAVAPPTEKPEPADWVASAGVAQIAATAASELAELHAWLGRDPLKTEKDWDPVLH